FTMSLEGKVVWVTGASRGIGAATILELARHGARVVAGARNVEQLETLRAHAETASGEIAITAMDVRREADVKAAIALARDRFGGLDALVNNAAIGALGRVEAQDAEEWRAVLDTN